MEQRMSNFYIFIDRILSNEGGYVLNPADPGGETKFGIAKRWHPNVDIMNLTRQQAIDIYHVEFWNSGGFEAYPDGVGFQTLDAAVNHGIPQANKLLQQAVGVKADGEIGPITHAAVKAMDETDILFRFIAYRLRFWTSLNTWATFGAGWANRAADDLLYAAQDS